MKYYLITIANGQPFLHMGELTAKMIMEYRNGIISIFDISNPAIPKEMWGDGFRKINKWGEYEEVK